MEVADNWTLQLRKGVVELCILNIIAHRRVYGYDIVRQLRDIDALGVSEGTVYPILSRLKRDGLLRTSSEKSAQGPVRKYLELTHRGQQLLDVMNSHWDRLGRGMSTLRNGRR